MEIMHIKTRTREEMISITDEVVSLIQEKGWVDGILVLHCPHTTAGLTINEDADPSVTRDILTSMRRLVPHQGDYRHAEGNSDAHIKTTTFGPSLSLIVENGKPCLGTWQGIFFCEFDGPRSRKLWAKWVG